MIRQRNARRPGGWHALLLLASLLVACGDRESPSTASGTGSPTNLLIITVDTLRADHLGAYGFTRPTSPAIDRLAAQSVVFEEAWATSSWTLTSLASAMTSLYPSTHGAVTAKTKLRDQFTTVAEHLAGAGFHTGGIASHIFLSPHFGLAQGFADYDEELIFAQKDRNRSHYAISSPRLTEKAMSWLAARTNEAGAGSEVSPWFLWLHYFDPHHMYLPHQSTAEQFGAVELIDLYDGEIAFTDEHLGRVLQRLEELGFSQNTVVILMADHGEEFGDHGGVMHRRTLYQEVLRVPWMIRVPGLTPRRIANPVSLVDMAPTIYELFDLVPPVAMQGRSVVSLMRGAQEEPRVLLAELSSQKNSCDAIRHGKYKLVRLKMDGTCQLFDLERDPRELSDLASQLPGVVNDLRQRLTDRLRVAKQARAAFRGDGRVELDERDLKTIRDLGYAGADEPQ